MKIELLIKALKKLQKETPGIEVKIGYEEHCDSGFEDNSIDTYLRHKDVCSISYQTINEHGNKVKPFIEII